MCIRDRVILIAESTGKWDLFGNWSFERLGDTSGPLIAISFFVPTMLLLLGDANMYQRIFSAENSSSAKKAVFFWIFGVVFLESIISLLGLTGAVAIAKGHIPDIIIQEQLLSNKDELSLLVAKQSASESIIPAIARYANLPIFLGLILVSTMMAIIVSTADSFLLIPATNHTRDVYVKYIDKEAKEKKILLVSRLLVLLLGLISYLLVSQFKTVLSAAFTAYNIYGTSITPSLLAAFLWKRATKEGAVASILAGTTTTIIWTYFLPSWAGFNNLNPFLKEMTYPAAGLSIFALVIGSLLTRAPSKETLDQFFHDK